MALLVVSSSIGVRIFNDRNTVLFADVVSPEEFFASMRLVSVFTYSDAVHGAVICDSIEHKCMFDF